MKKKINSKIFLSLLAVVLVAAMALGFAACGDKDKKEPDTKAQAEDATQLGKEPDTKAQAEGATQLGEGQKTVNFEVKNKDGSVKKFLIKTDSETLGEALLESGLVTIKDGMVMSVCGVEYDYVADKMWWALYVNGELATVGVDQTKIDSNASYSFIATPA